MANQINRPSDIVLYKEFLATCINYWYWFVGLVVAFMLLAVVHLVRTPKMYTSRASVLVMEDEKTQGGVAKISREFATMGLAQSTLNINNEMARFMSHEVLTETARRMDFGTQYWHKLRIRTELLYGKKVPVEVAFLDADDKYTAKMMMHIRHDGSILLNNFVRNGEELAGEMRLAHPVAGEVLETPAGRIRLMPQEDYAASNQTIHVTHTTPLAAGRNIGLGLQVTYPNRKNSILELSYRDQAAARANDVLHTLIEIYNEQWIKEQGVVADATSQFLTDRIVRLQTELGLIDGEISDYKSNHHITDMNGVDRMYLDQYSKNEMEIAALESQREMVTHAVEKLRIEHSHELLPVSIGVGNHSLEQHIRDYNNSVIEINEHLSYTSEDNPLIGNLDDRIEKMKQAIILGLDNEKETLEISIASKREKSSEILGRIQSSPDQAMFLLSVERQQKVKESLFLYLLQKQEEVELSQSYTSPRIQVLNTPTLDDKTTPDAKKILILALLAGLMIPAAVLILMQIMDTSVRTARDLYGQLSMPYLGEIPFAQQLKKGGHPLVVSASGNDALNEAFRSLRTQLAMLEKKHEGGLVYVVTSIAPDSGKSFVTTNLSASLAVQGKRVIVVDGDLRHSTYSRSVDGWTLGLTDYLSEQATLDQVVMHQQGYACLDYIAAGTPTTSPTEMLNSAGMEQLMQTLRERYDFVLVDCPPINIVADTHIIESLADRSLYVLRAGKIEKAQLPLLEDEYKNNLHPKMSVVLNGVKQPNRWGLKWGYTGYGQSMRYVYKSLLLLFALGLGFNAKAQEVEPKPQETVAKVSRWATGEKDNLALIWYIGVNKSVNEHLPWMDWSSYPFGWGTHIGLAQEWTSLWGWRATIGYDFNKARRTRTCEERTWYAFHDLELFADLTLDLCDLFAPARVKRDFNAKLMLGAGGLIGFGYPTNVPLSYLYPYDAKAHASFGFRPGLLLSYRVAKGLHVGLELEHNLMLDNFSGVIDWHHTEGIVNPDPVSPLDGRTNLMVGLVWNPQPKVKGHKAAPKKQSPKNDNDSLLNALAIIVPEAHEVAIRTLSGRAYIDFPVNMTDIYPQYRENPTELRKLEKSIEDVLWDKSVTILSISLHGYASPESPYSNNERLARERSNRIRLHVMEKYNISPDIIDAQYTPEDWAGLRNYVSEKMQLRAYRDEILRLIDTPMDEDEKELQLKKIGGGKPYKELYTVIYPALRHTDYVITYQIEDNKAPLDVRKLLYRHPELLSLGDITREAVKHEAGSPEWYDILMIAARQFADDPIAVYNAGVACLRTKRMRDARTFLNNTILDDMPEAQQARTLLK